jgi:hypothetical protein
MPASRPSPTPAATATSRRPERPAAGVSGLPPEPAGYAELLEQLKARVVRMSRNGLANGFEAGPCGVSCRAVRPHG